MGSGHHASRDRHRSDVGVHRVEASHRRSIQSGTSRARRAGEDDDGYQRRHRISRSAERSSRGTRRVLPTLKLGTFNGSSCLRTFLSKFENCSDYYEWSDMERLCHLRASLEGPAGQVHDAALLLMISLSY